MNLVACATALLALTATPAVAQNTSAPAPDTVAPASTARFTLDTPIDMIAADSAGKAVLDADFPGMTTHPAYDQFKGMSLAELQPMAQGQITDEQMAKAKTDLEAIK